MKKLLSYLAFYAIVMASAIFFVAIVFPVGRALMNYMERLCGL